MFYMSELWGGLIKWSISIMGATIALIVLVVSKAVITRTTQSQNNRNDLKYLLEEVKRIKRQLCAMEQDIEEIKNCCLACSGYEDLVKRMQEQQIMIDELRNIIAEMREYIPGFTGA